MRVLLVRAFKHVFPTYILWAWPTAVKRPKRKTSVLILLIKRADLGNWGCVHKTKRGRKQKRASCLYFRRSLGILRTAHHNWNLEFLMLHLIISGLLLSCVESWRGFHNSRKLRSKHFWLYGELSQFLELQFYIILKSAIQIYQSSMRELCSNKVKFYAVWIYSLSLKLKLALKHNQLFIDALNRRLAYIMNQNGWDRSVNIQILVWFWFLTGKLVQLVDINSGEVWVHWVYLHLIEIAHDLHLFKRLLWFFSECRDWIF